MEQFVLVLLIFFGTCHGLQEYSGVESDEPNIELEDEQQEMSQYQEEEEKITNEESSNENLPELQRPRRYLEDTQDQISYPSTEIIRDIKNLKKQLKYLQDQQQQPYQHEKNMKIIKINNKLQNLIDLLQFQQEAEERQMLRRFISKDENCKNSPLRRYLLKPEYIATQLKPTKPKLIVPDLENVVLFAPSPIKQHQKYIDYGATKNIVYNGNIPRKPKQNQHKRIVSHYSRRIEPSDETPAVGSESNGFTQTSKMILTPNEFQNTMKNSKNVRCLKTMNIIICAASLN